MAVHRNYSIRMKDRTLTYVFMDILRVMFRALEFGQLQSRNQNNDIHFNLILNNSKIRNRKDH